MKERLTYEIRDGGWCVDASDIKKFWIEEDFNVYSGNAIWKLKDYENAEDNRLLIKLPCKLGDTVWCTTSDQYDSINQPIECKFVGFGMSEDDDELWFEVYSKLRTSFEFGIDLPAHMNKRKLSDFGKNVFLSKEEALLYFNKGE